MKRQKEIVTEGSERRRTGGILRIPQSSRSLTSAASSRELPTLKQQKLQILTKVLEKEQRAEEDRHEMLALVHNVKKRQRLEAIFEKERKQACERIHRLAQELDEQIERKTERTVRS